VGCMSMMHPSVRISSTEYLGRAEGWAAICKGATSSGGGVKGEGVMRNRGAGHLQVASPGATAWLHLCSSVDDGRK
jgi:hypothetical protein